MVHRAPCCRGSLGGRRAVGVVLLAWGVASAAVGCDHRESRPTPSSIDAGVRASTPEEELLSADAALPGRAEVVAITDRLAIASSRSDAPGESAELGRVAARLRERLWRFDRRSTDAREAAELYASVVEAAPGTAMACQADVRRALLVGEISRDPARGYAALYLAKRRHGSQQEQDEDSARQSCVAEMDQLLALQEAYRPVGADWTRLVEQGDAAEIDEQRRAAARPDGSAAPSGPDVPPAKIVLGPNKRNVLVAPDPSQLSDEPVELTKVQHFSGAQGGRVVLTLTGPTTYTLGSLPPNADAGRGHRVYLDVARTKLKVKKREMEAKGLVDGIRLGRRSGGVRVVVDLSQEAYHRVFFLPEPFRVVMDLGTRQAAPAAPVQGGAKRSVRRVALDPGHGGEDDGAVGPTGLREKDVTLDIAHRAAPTLAHELGVETMLTRDTDTYVFLEERIARANAFHADLFVSIHCNATEDGQARGVQLFVLDPSREMDAVAQRVAALENSFAAHGRRPFDSKLVGAQIAAVAAGLSSGDLAKRSGRFAELLRASTHASLDQRYGKPADHGIRTAAFYVLLGAEMPAVLYETAFISNPDDEALLATADFRQKLADSIVNAVRAYREGR